MRYDVVELAAKKSRKDTSPSIAAQRPGDDATPARMSILVVDDAEDTRYAYQRYFEFKGAEVTTAADGAAALECVKRRLPDVIVLDIAMPRVTGFEVLAALRAEDRTRHVPIIVLSGQQAREQALAAGATCYCEKPCMPDDLYHMAVQLFREKHGPVGS